MQPSSFPSPSRNAWDIGPLSIHGYALCVLVAVASASWFVSWRWRRRGGEPGVVGDFAIWVVPAGLIGARLYHVITTPEPYFGKGGHPLDGLAVWKPGLAVWGAIGGGFASGYVWASRRGINKPMFADVVAPALLVAQAIGRLGNYINQEIYGRPTDLPWAVEIDPLHRPLSSLDRATYHPTFLYELLWDLLVLAVILYAEKRWRLRDGRVFATYVLGYVIGRAWIESLRVDFANHILGLRVNEWVCLVLGIGAVVYLRYAPRSPLPEAVDKREGEVADSGTLGE